MSRPVIIPQGDNIIPMPVCGKCCKKLHFKEYTNPLGVPCITTKVIVENYCPNCGEKVEGYEDESQKYV